MRLQRILPIAFFTLYFLGGLLVFRDYGVSFDELCQRYTGGVTAKYLVETFYPSYLDAHPELNSITPQHEYGDRYYGVAFELPVAVAEKALGFQEDTAGLYYMRHLATFLCFFVGLVFFYGMARERFGSAGWALLGTAALALYPRFFAESFYNSKDIVFLAFFIMGLWGLQRFMRQRTLWSAILLAVMAALATNVRVLGVMLPLAGTGVVVWELLLHRTAERKPGRELGFTALMLAGFCLVLYVSWPVLWRNPIADFKAAFTSMSVYEWQGSVPYMGHEVNAATLPWHYIPVWMGITLPVGYLLAFLLGVAVVVVNILRSRLRLWSDAAQRMDFACLMLFIAPPLAAIVLHSVLYNAWRQMYFIAGPMMMLALAGLHALHKRMGGGWKAWLVPGLAGLQMAANLFLLVRLHPYQNVYFNFLAGKDYQTRYELDYWGLGYRESLEYVRDHDPADSLTVRTWSYTGVMARAWLSPEDKARIHTHVDDSLMQGRLPDYHITELALPAAVAKDYEVVHEVKAGPLTLNWVYKRTTPQLMPPAPLAVQDTAQQDSLPH